MCIDPIMRFGLTLLLAAVANVDHCRGEATEDAESASAAKLKYGFGFDPMKWVEQSGTVHGALVRRHVFRKPMPGDEAILKKRITEILDGQKKDGGLANGIKGTAERLMELVELGADTGRPEVKRVANLLLKERTREHADNFKHISVRGTRALVMMGITDLPEVKEAVKTMVDREKVWTGPWRLCPWGTQLYVDSLWEGREVYDTRPIVKRTLGWIADGLNEAGCMSYKDPWSFVSAAGRIDLPEARRVVERQVPMILRAQKSDGGWGGHSFAAFRALVRHGFLEPLRKLPPLAPDWKIVRSIPAPCDEPAHLVFGDGHLWALDRKTGVVFAVSTSDGSVKKRLKLSFKKAKSVGWWDGGPGVVQSKPKRLLKLDPETGDIVREVSLAKLEWPQGFAQVGNELWVYDAWFGTIMRIDPKRPEKRRHHGHTGGGSRITAMPDGVCCIQDFAPLIVQTHTKGKLLDWAETPFDGCAGLAWDGKKLWALDAKAKRICIIEKNNFTGRRFP